MCIVIYFKNMLLMHYDMNIAPSNTATVGCCVYYDYAYGCVYFFYFLLDFIRAVIGR